MNEDVSIALCNIRLMELSPATLGKTSAASSSGHPAPPFV